LAQARQAPLPPRPVDLAQVDHPLAAGPQLAEPDSAAPRRSLRSWLRLLQLLRADSSQQTNSPVETTRRLR
jgi:hypothetical protein